MSASTPKLLVVDDGDRYVELAHELLRQYRFATRCDRPGPCWSCEVRPGCTLTHAHDLDETIEALGRHPDVDVVLLDLAFDLPEARLAPSTEPDLERRRRLQGLEILRALRRRAAQVPVVLMTSGEDLALEDAADSVAVDELLTLAGDAAFDARALALLVERVMARRGSSEVDDRTAGAWTWGRSAAMARLRRDAATLARTSLPMLLLGETGTGKSALGERVIHPATGRRGPFVAVDLASIPATLAAAELFGTAVGAFSGAVARPGRFEAAHGGTLLLDEIGNLPLEVQRMLLLALQDARVTRLGETSPRPVDVKLVAATNADLAGAVASGAFRADLWARLNPSAPLVLPPLRERRDDVPVLAAAFVERAFAAGSDRALLEHYGRVAGRRIRAARLAHAPPRAAGPGTPDDTLSFVMPRGAQEALRAHPWPGNVRELELVVRTATALALADAVHAAEEGRVPPGDTALEVPIPLRLLRELLGAGGPRPSRGAVAGGLVLELEAGRTLHEVARSLERQAYERLFAETRGDFGAMARRLLGDATSRGERRVLQRFNQLGLKVRGRRSTNRG